MQIKIVENQKEWTDFIEGLDFNTFLHSEGWIKFNQSYGHDVRRFGLYDEKKLISACLILTIEAKRGKFLFCPHGPQSKNFSSKELSKWKDFLVDLAKKENCDFIRFSPIYPNTEKFAKIFKENGFILAPIHMHAELTTVVDLKPAEKEILSNMRKTTRQMVKKGDKLLKSGEVEIDSVDKITDEMHEVYISTTNRGGFVPFTREYLQEEYNSFINTGDCELIEIKYKEKVLSWGLFIKSGKHCFYHQGANILTKEVPSSYMTHWYGMKWAKSKGCETYDFWGVAPKDKANHPWANISLFKRGFGGEDVELLHAQDLPISLKYWFTWIIEKIRAKRRGF